LATYLESNPFQVLTFIVAPAILTNASSLLSLTTANRFARVVDRVRSLSDKLKVQGHLTSAECELYRKQLFLTGRRSLLLVRALTAFYIAVGMFAATTLSSLLGAGASVMATEFFIKIFTYIALGCGLTGVGSILTGTSLLTREMWMAHAALQAEVAFSETYLLAEALLEPNNPNSTMTGQ
jgi:hypothetical protein